ncbi:hypothetical protein AR685_02985 [Chryseobacterium sp. JAH]|nr:hypothetical protein AR685_02985 [Chryseobacterium sp. JAH]
MDQFSKKTETWWLFSPDRNGYPTASNGKAEERGVIVDSRISKLPKKNLVTKTRSTNEKL